MKKIMLLLIAVLTIQTISTAQSNKLWKRQIYGGYSKNINSYLSAGISRFEFNLADKKNRLYNVSYVKSIFNARDLDLPQRKLLTFGNKPMVYTDQFSVSFGKRWDFLPKWSISTSAGLNFTHKRYPTAVEYYHNKGYFLTTSYILTEYSQKNSVGLLLTSELNFNLCENLMLFTGFIYDINNAQSLGGFTFGGKVGVIKQKNETRSIFRTRKLSAIKF